MHKMSKPLLKEKICLWRVRTSLFGIVLAVILSKTNISSILWGIGVTLLGLVVRGWACGHLRKEKELTVSGPYRYTRNPLYLGNLIIGIGVVIGAQSLWILAYFVVYFCIFYPVAIIQEREKMKRLFSKEYEDFSRDVSLFFPFLKHSPPHVSRKFDWRLYKANKESRALIGALVFWAALVLKHIFYNLNYTL